MNEKTETEQEKEARRILKQIAGETEPTGNSYIGRGLGRARDHFAADDADSRDPIEVWGTRIGRALGVAIVIGMLVWLIFTFIGT